MQRGRPRKRVRNISGLRNQPNQDSASVSPSRSRAPSPPDLVFDRDGLKVNAKEALGERNSESESDEEVSPWEDLDDEEALEKLVDITFKCGGDEDWLPDAEYRKRKKQHTEKRRTFVFVVLNTQ
jgi:hypothetical protein